MKKSLPLLALAFSLVAGCSKKTDPATTTPPASASASYNLDGRATIGTGYTKFYAASANTAGKDALVIVINPTTAGATSEDVVLYYYKAAGAATSQYKFDRFLLDGPSGGDYTLQASSALTQTASSNWSGTFAGSQGTSSNIKHVLKDGVFTELN